MDVDKSRRRYIGYDAGKVVTGELELTCLPSASIVVDTLIIDRTVVGAVEAITISYDDQMMFHLLAGHTGVLATEPAPWAPEQPVWKLKPFLVEAQGVVELGVSLRAPVRFKGCLIGYPLVEH